jgi:hypothetical protein
MQEARIQIQNIKLNNIEKKNNLCEDSPIINALKQNEKYLSPSYKELNINKEYNDYNLMSSFGNPRSNTKNLLNNITNDS